MQWVTVIWSMIAAACLTLAAMHFVIWLRQRDVWGHLLFSCSAVSAAVLAGFELEIMHARTPDEYGALIRWAHLPLFFVLVSMVFFIRVYLRAGRPWLGYSVVAARALALIVNFVVAPNLNFRAITGIRHTTLIGGETISIAEGQASPWSLIGQISSLLMLIFIVDAMITVWRRGDRRRALVVAGSMALFIALAAGHAALVTWGVVQTPSFISIAYLGIIVAMGYELSLDVVHAASLARRLQANEMALLESEQRMDLAVGASGLGIWTWDIIADSFWLSDQGRRLFAIGESEPVSFDRCLKAVHPNDREQTLHSIANAMNRDGELQAEFRVPLSDGRVRWIATRGRVEFNEGGKPARLRGIYIEITARREAEIESQQQRAELAHLSRVTMLGELSGSLAHELNQPLTAILSNAEAAQQFMAREPVDLKEVRAILHDIVEDDNRAGEVIRRLRLLLQKGELQRQELDVNETIRDVLKLVRSDLLNHGVSVQADLADGLPSVSADRVQLQQVLLNLIMNGCDAMATNAPPNRQLSLSTARLDGADVTISIVDRGCGIPPQRLEQVFSPFYTTKPNGMGLGLAVCRTIIMAHGGRLWAANNPDQGAVFHVALPMAQAGHEV